MILLYLTRLTLPSAPQERRHMASERAHSLLRWALREMDIASETVPLCRTPEGKPYLAHTGLQISISHSGPWAVCALSNAPVGVDLERIRPVTEGVWRKLLAAYPEEPQGDAHETILRWTRYEASLKRLGYPAPLPEDVAFTTLNLIPGYLLTVCGEGGVDALRYVSEQSIE